MALLRLTDITLAQSSAITPTTLIHIVYTGDPSQNLAGSSYKAELSQLTSIFSGTTFTGGTVIGDTYFTGGLSANTISATTYQNLPIDPDTYTTAFTYNNNTFTISDNSGNTFSQTVNDFTGLTINGDLNVTGNTTLEGLTATTISATTYLNLPNDLNTYVTGFTYSSNTLTILDNSGNTFPVVINDFTGLTINGDLNVTGNTVLNNLSANTISATTYDNLPVSGVSSVGLGEPIFKIINNGVAEIKSISGTSNNKISATTFSDTILLDVIEPNLTLWNLVVQGNKLLDGSVTWISGLTFQVSDLSYIINGVIYSSLATTLTLQSGDTTFDRIDVIYADTGSTVGVLSGTPSNNPEKPLVDNDTQVEVTFVSIPANSTGGTISGFTIYDESAGTPTEWNFLAYGNQTSKFNPNFTGQTYSGSKSISITGATGTTNFGFYLSSATPVDITEYSSLQFALKNVNGLGSNTRLYIYLIGSGGVITSTYTQQLWNGASSFPSNITYSTTNTSTWQLISIPLWRFYATNNSIYGIIVRPYNASPSQSVNLYLDKFQFVGGVPVNPPSNAWFGIRGDATTTTITPLSPNYTLIISGGTNIGSTVTSPNRVNINLDNNISLSGITTGTLRVTSGATNGYVLTSDASGNATWQPSSGGGTFTGGTVTGATNFTGGLTANTISATTYQNLPIDPDTYITAFTYNNNTFELSDNSGNTFAQVVNDFTGLTINGDFNVTGNTVLNNLSANTISATTYQNLPIDPDTYVTAFTYNDNTFTISDNSGNTFTQVVNDFTGLTINGGLSATTFSATTIGASGNCVTDLYVSNIHSCSPLNINPLNEGNVYFGSTSAVTIDLSNNKVGIGITSPTAKLHINNVTTDNTVLFEDDTNPDSSPFVINNSGSVGIGTTTPNAKLHISGLTGASSFTLLISPSGGTDDFYVKNDSSVSSRLGYQINGNLFLHGVKSNPVDSNIFVGISNGNTAGSGFTNVGIGYLNLTGLSTNTSYNVAIGYRAGNGLTSDSNVAIGTDAMYSYNTVGGKNVAIGYYALRTLNSLVSNMVAIGNGALQNYNNTTGGNVAIGASSCNSMTTGTRNTAIGDSAMRDSTTGTQNVSIGEQSLLNVTGASDSNVAIGKNSLRGFRSGSNNIAVGDGSGDLGFGSLFSTPLNTSVFLGGASTIAYQLSGTGVSSSIAIGYTSTIRASNQLVIGGRNAAITTAFIGKGVASSTIQSVSLSPTGIFGSNIPITPAVADDVPQTNTSASAGIFYIDGAKGTGTGIGGDIRFRVALAGSSGNTQNSLTEALFIKGDTANIGIGISSPTAKFHINNTTSGNTVLFEDDTNPDSSPFVIDSSGNTGIGTLSPTAKLDISGSTGYNQLRVRTLFTPTTSGDTSGNVGDITWDNDYVYVKTFSGWGRTQLTYSF